MPTLGNNIEELKEKINGAANYTIITTDGKVVHQGEGGVVIIDADNLPILEVSEISDDEVTNLFVQPLGEGSGLFVDDPDPKFWQILRNRK